MELTVLGKVYSKTSPDWWYFLSSSKFQITSLTFFPIIISLSPMYPTSITKFYVWFITMSSLEKSIHSLFFLLYGFIIGLKAAINIGLSSKAKQFI